MLLYWIFIKFYSMVINKKNLNTGKKPRINDLKEEQKTKSIEYIYNNPYNEYLSTKDIIKFFILCLILLLADLIEVTFNKMNPNNKKEENVKNKDNKENKGKNFSLVTSIKIFQLY